MKETNNDMSGLNGSVTPDLNLQSSRANEIQFVSFRLLDETFGVPIENVREILKVSDITPIPRAPAYLLGMMNLRGHILPVIDLKIRLGLGDSGEITGTHRVLVLYVGGEIAGVLVDEVFHVQHLPISAIEPPPQVLRGIDKFFLDGVAKTGQPNVLNKDLQDVGEEHLIMMLNLPEVLKLDIAKNLKIAAADQVLETLKKESETACESREEEELAVTFNLGEEEFGLEISAVKEILKVGEVTSAPNVPPYVRGIRNVRDMVLPIIDLRRLINMIGQDEEIRTTISRFYEAHVEWVSGLKAAVENGAVFRGAINPEHCELGRLLARKADYVSEFTQDWRALDAIHRKFHESGAEVLEWLSTDREAAVGVLNDEVIPQSRVLLGRLQALGAELESRARREQRILVIELGRTLAGLLVDRVTQVFRLPKKLIDTTPGVISAHDREIRGIARLDGGKRLIMMLDEKNLISHEETRQIESMQEHRKEREISGKKNEERQYVIFSLLGEEFGLGIEHVQEIFKAREITPVPKTPAFIRGVANLRGSVIPIVDTAERFGVEYVTDADGVGGVEMGVFKILVVSVRDSVVGLLVDQVMEVIRIPRRLIEDAPALVLSNTDASYLEGVAKLENGARIILLLSVDDIMNKKDFLKLKGLREKLKSGFAPDASESPAQRDNAEKEEKKAVSDSSHLESSTPVSPANASTVTANKGTRGKYVSRGKRKVES